MKIFISITLLQQVIANVFILGWHYHVNLIAAIVDLLVLGITITYILSFKNTKIKIPIKQLIWIPIAIFTMYLLSALTQTLLPIILKLGHQIQVPKNQQTIEMFYKQPYTAAFIITFTLIMPIFEEFAFRYLIINPKRISPKQTLIRLIISTLLFAVYHTLQQIGIAFNLWCFYTLEYIVIGLILGILYVKFRNFKLNVTTHICWNLLSILPIILNLI